jgi:hypothetical protein
MKQFLYELDDLSFDLPWTKPDLYRLRLWFYDLVRTFPDSKNFDFHILGDYWSSGRPDAWSIVLFASTGEFASLHNEWPAGFAATVLDMLRQAVSIGLERHRMLVEVSFSSPLAANKLHQQIQLAESGKQSAGESAVAFEPRYEAFRHIRKSVNGGVERELDLEFNQKLTAGNGTLYERSGLYERTLLEKASKGRVYYRPENLKELCGAIGQSNP